MAGAVLHSTGNQLWVKQTTIAMSLRGVWGSGPDDVYVVGDGGVIQHSMGDGTWTPQTAWYASNGLTAVWGKRGGRCLTPSATVRFSTRRETEAGECLTRAI